MTGTFLNISTTKFSLNGLEYHKVFIPVKVSDTHLKVVNVYDTKFVLLQATRFDDVTVGGSGFASLADAMSGLLDVVYYLEAVEKTIPVTDEFFFSAGDSQTKTLRYNPINGLVRIYVKANRIYSTQYNLLNQQTVQILDALTDGDPIAIDYQKLSNDLIASLLLLTPEGGIEQWTVDRNSEATYVDVNGVIQTAPINTARIDYSTGSARILVEGEATNLISNSEISTSAVLGSPTINTQVVDSDFFSGVAKKIESTGSSLVQINSSATAGVISCFSYFLKNISGDYIIRFPGTIANTSGNVTFDNQGNVVSNLSSIVINNITLTPLSNGMEKISVTFTPDKTVADNVTCYIGTNGSILTNDAQLEEGSTATSHIPTAGSTVTRLADVITVAPLTGTTEITEVIDGVTNTVTTIPATYQIPQGNVSKIEMT